MVTLAFLSELRQRMRIEGSEFDSELKALIEAARAELRRAGIRRSCVNEEQDALITEAIVTYVKAEFGLTEAKERQGYSDAFESKCRKLALSSDYLEKKRGGG